MSGTGVEQAMLDAAHMGTWELEVASGRKTWAEKWGLGNALSPFNPGPVT